MFARKREREREREREGEGEREREGRQNMALSPPAVGEGRPPLGTRVGEGRPPRQPGPKHVQQTMVGEVRPPAETGWEKADHPYDDAPGMCHHTMGTGSRGVKGQAWDRKKSGHPSDPRREKPDRRAKDPSHNRWEKSDHRRRNREWEKADHPQRSGAKPQPPLR